MGVTGSIPVASTIPTGPYWGFRQPPVGFDWATRSNIYIIRSGPCGRFLKIGLASDCKARLAHMRVSTPHELTLERRYDTYAAIVSQIERCIHEELRAYRVRGEWFEVDLALAAEVAARWKGRGNAFLIRLAREINAGRREWEPGAAVEPLPEPPRPPRAPRSRPPAPGRVTGSGRKARLASYKSARGL